MSFTRNWSDLVEFEVVCAAVDEIRRKFPQLNFIPLDWEFNAHDSPFVVTAYLPESANSTKFQQYHLYFARKGLSAYDFRDFKVGKGGRENLHEAEVPAKLKMSVRRHISVETELPAQIIDQMILGAKDHPVEFTFTRGFKSAKPGDQFEVITGSINYFNDVSNVRYEKCLRGEADAQL